jgi:hypothetical protein
MTMIFISGTKRSGTSMWMQVLRAAGIPILGTAYPHNWESVPLRDANPDGFYESILRNGIYFRTNPHPVTGQYFMPEDVAGFGVKVFVPGVIRSERAYIRCLVANFRAWPDYVTSIARLRALEQASQPPGSRLPLQFPAAYEWWVENFALVRDISLRRYPARLRTYDEVVEDPERSVRETLLWIGCGDVASAIAAVKPERRTQYGDAVTGDPLEVHPRHARVFDDLYAAIAAHRPIDGALLRTLNATNQELLPRLQQLQAEVARSHAELARERRAIEPPAIEGLPVEMSTPKRTPI